MRVFTTSRFERRLKFFLKFHPDLSSRVRRVMKDVSIDPFASHLKTHKLGGSLKECRGSNITYDYKVVFVIDGNSVCFVDIGTHDEVYR